MLSRSVYYLQFYKYVQLVGDAAAESGSDAGSYDARNYVWHLNCCNPEDKSSGGSGWAILNSLVGWNNTANIGSLLSYIFYWLAIALYLVYTMIKEKKSRKAKKQNKVTV
jgi:high-affinity iron transporter